MVLLTVWACNWWLLSFKEVDELLRYVPKTMYVVVQVGMADPLFTPALVGAAVSSLLQEAIISCKGAVHLKESCKALKSKVDGILPLLTEASAQSGNWGKVAVTWSENFKVILQDAGNIAKQCTEESKYETAVRLTKFWKWRRLSKRVNAISARIDEARCNAPLVSLGINQTLAPKATSSGVQFVTQPIPPLIVGVEEIFNKLKSSVMASFGTDKASYLAVRGRGGAGKTLLAKQLHNDEDIQATYGRESIFWITVGSDARIHDIYKTMGNFLDEREFQAYHVTKNLEDQRSYLLNAFSKRKVFMILDDVWSKGYEYHTMIYWLALATTCGSTTLVTSRSGGILSNIAMESSSTQGALMSSSTHVKEEVVLMLSQEDSWKLFCFHAFQGSTTSASIIELAREVCEECKGLPLALKVIGSAMREKQDVEEWERALHDLRRARPISNSNVDEELYDRLRLSYNELKSDELRRCFLFCAAFPEDDSIFVSTLTYVWTIEGLVDGEDEVMSHLETLVRRSMFEWGDNSKDLIVVHDILRDLAMHIIDTSKYGDCANEYIFQSGKELTSFSKFKSLEAVTTMSLNASRVLQWPRTFATPHLRVLLLNNMVGPLQIPQQIFSGLRALQYLDLSWNRFDEHYKLPSFEGLVGLLKLDLSFCQDLDELPESIGELKSLLELNLWGCSKLEEIPKRIGNLKCLTRFYTSWCESLNELPESIGELESLERLHIGGCKMLKKVPMSIGELKFLTYLDLGLCVSLVKLPQSIGKLKCLSVLNLKGCKMLKEVPNTIGELRSLRNLTIEGCEALVELPESIGELKSLRYLSFYGCTMMEKVPQSILDMKGRPGLRFRGTE